MQDPKPLWIVGVLGRLAASPRSSASVGGKKKKPKKSAAAKLLASQVLALSLSSLRASMACMLDRYHQIGDTAGLCAKRREAVVLVEEDMRRQREAQHLARVRGGHLLRRGHILG